MLGSSLSGGRKAVPVGSLVGSTDCILEVTVEGHVEDAGTRPRCRPFWPPWPFRKGRSYGPGIIPWIGQVEEGEGRVAVEGVRNQLKLVMLDWQSAKLRRCQDEEEKNKPD